MRPVRPGLPSDVRAHLFGGEGEVRVFDLGGRMPPFACALWCELSAGGTVGPHQQDQCEELIIALQGEGVLYVDRMPHPATAGTCVELPLGSVLEIDNASLSEPFSYLIVKARRSI